MIFALTKKYLFDTIIIKQESKLELKIDFAIYSNWVLSTKEYESVPLTEDDKPINWLP